MHVQGRAGRAETVHQGDRGGVVQARVNHGGPRVTTTGGQRHAGDGQVGAGLTADLGLGGDGATAPEGLHLAVAQQDRGRGVAGGPCGGGAKALGRLRAVGDRGVQREEREVRVRHPLVAHVRDGEVGEPGEEVARDTGRDDPVPPVQVADAHGGRARVLQDGLADQAQLVRRSKRGAQCEAKVLVDLLVDHRTGRDRLGEGPADPAAADRLSPGLPDILAVATHRADHGEGTAGAGPGEQAVNRLVGEDREILVAAPGGARAVGAGEEPQVAVADHVDHERVHAVHVPDHGARDPVHDRVLRAHPVPARHAWAGDGHWSTRR